MIPLSSDGRFYLRAARALAAVTDALAAVGERMPGVSQVTVTLGGASVTVVPRPPPAPPTCATCGKGFV